MVRALYSIALYLAVPLILLRLAIRSLREPGYRNHWGERFGFGAARATTEQRPIIWLHAVSVGEVRAALPLITGLARRFPTHALLLTCMTPTGREMAMRSVPDSVNVRYLPYDLPGAMSRFIAAWQPKILLVMETELWPNMLATCERYSVRRVLVNARLSEKSRAGYARFAPVAALARQALGRFDAVLAQSPDDAQRLRSLGASRVDVSGNVKFDLVPDAQLIDLGKSWQQAIRPRAILLLASTREGEEALLLPAFVSAFADTTSRPLLVLVPRHPARVEEVLGLVAAAGLRATRRSKQAPAVDDDVWIGDSMGEMPAYYAMCDATIIGGSFALLGGQNLIEAAAVGTPIIIGPSTFNFAEATRLALAAGALVQVSDASESMTAVAALLKDPAQRERMSQAGVGFTTLHRGATERSLVVVEQLLLGATTQAPVA
jgi:3-deoxy-D-manno-octulosonic-acid transferase